MVKSKKTLGQELKNLRLIKGLSLRELENETKISNAYLSQLETGKVTNPTVNVLFDLAKYYEIELSTLIDVMEKSNTISPSNKKLTSSFSSMQHAITPEEETELIDYLQFIRSRNK